MRRFTLILSLFLAANAVAAPLQLRVATFNASLNRSASGQLASDLAVTTNTQARSVAQIVQRVAPDILLVNEFDYDAANPTGPTSALDRFHNNYLAISQSGQPALNYPYRYIAPSNTGVATGKTLATEGDFDNNGSVDTTPGDDTYGNDCFGFGWFPGQYSFAVYSKYPIQTAAIRSFRFFKWKDMPAHVMPPGYYTAAEQSIFRLSSKNHVDLPIELKPGHLLHLLASHPTPPAFDGAEDRNGRRNYDEIRLWADYLKNTSYLYDDAGVFGGLANAAQQRFIILGDMNADPFDGDSFTSGGVRAINQLRNHALINSAPNPSSPGGTQQAALQGGINGSHQGNPAYDTSDFSDFSVGNLRVDHILPSKIGFAVIGQGVFWPLNTDPTFSLVSASDHRLVYLDLVAVPILSQAVRNLTAARQGADVIVSWGTQAGVTYTLQTSPDLLAWADAPGLPIVFDTPAQTATVIDPGVGGGPPKYYRLVCTIEP